MVIRMILIIAFFIIGWIFVGIFWPEIKSFFNKMKVEMKEIEKERADKVKRKEKVFDIPIDFLGKEIDSVFKEKGKLETEIKTVLFARFTDVFSEKTYWTRKEIEVFFTKHQIKCTFLEKLFEEYVIFSGQLPVSSSLQHYYFKKEINIKGEERFSLRYYMGYYGKLGYPH